MEVIEHEVPEVQNARLQERVDHLAEVSRVEVGCSVAVLDERAHVHFQSLAVDTEGEELMDDHLLQSVLGCQCPVRLATFFLIEDRLPSLLQCRL